jgi:ArsR family metal-binding transcriptional regulator
MLLNSYQLKMERPDCNHAAVTVNALADLSDDISPVLPYLNAVLSRARYMPKAPALSFEHEGHRIVLRPRQVAVAGLQDEDDARQVLAWLVEKINRTWEHRAEIEPNDQAARELTLFEVYRLLPGGNCRDCGEATCMAFAARLLRDEVEVAACQPLFAQQHVQNCAKLLALLQDAGHAVPVSLDSGGAAG